MSSDLSPLHQQLLDTAEALFAERGFAAVRLRDIADRLGVKHTALYYHVPGGKEALYVEAMRRSFARHRAGMEAAIEAAGARLEDQLRAVTEWLLAHPPVNLARMELSDFPALDPEHAAELAALAFDALRLPLEAALERAGVRGEIDVPNPGLAAISFVSLVQTIHASSAPYMAPVKEQVIADLVHMTLFGWLRR